MASEIPTSENLRQTNYKTHVSPTILQCQQSTTDPDLYKNGKYVKGYQRTTRR